MEVDSCGSTTVTGKRHVVYSFEELQTSAPEGVYAVTYDEETRFVVLCNERGGRTVLCFADGLLQPAEDCWRGDLFIRCTDEKVCFEIR